MSGNTAAQELTLEEQRAIEEEARKTGIQEAEAKAKEQRKNQPETAVVNGGKDGAVAGPPGRDSGFCSEQDQKQKQQEQQNHEVNRNCSSNCELIQISLSQRFSCCSFFQYNTMNDCCQSICRSTLAATIRCQLIFQTSSVFSLFLLSVIVPSHS